MKKSLKASGITLVLCLAMLIGTTFAWFTDSITNSGNKIQAGSLNIGAVAYDIATDGDKTVTIPGVNGGNAFSFEAEGTDLEKSTEPIINDSIWEPGKTNAKLLQVTNKGTLAAKIKLNFDVKDGGLQNALWFDFVMVDESWNVQGAFQERPMSQLQQVAENIELPLAKGESVQFVLVYGMNKEAGNEYQGKTFTTDVTILAKQDTVEEDGFGSNQYDKDADYSYVSTEEELHNALKVDNALVILKDNITINDPLVIEENLTATIDLNDKTLSLTDEVPIKNKGNLTVRDGNIKSHSTIDKPKAAVYSESGSLELKDCVIESTSDGSTHLGSYSVQIRGGDATFTDCVIIGKRGGFDVGGTANVTVNGGTYSACAYYPVYVWKNAHFVANNATFKKDTSLGAVIDSFYLVYSAVGNGTLDFNNCEFHTPTYWGVVTGNKDAVNLNDCKVYKNGVEQPIK